jgi:hypothetical protein
MLSPNIHLYRKSASLCFLGIWFMFIIGFTPAWAAVSITDPAGDTWESLPYNDFLAMEVWEQNQAMIFRLDFADASGLFYGAVLLDLDGNRRTRGKNLSLTDGCIDFIIYPFGAYYATYTDEANVVTTLNCLFQQNSFYIALPRALLPADLSKLELAAVAGKHEKFCDNRDRIPDAGFVNYQTGEVRVDPGGYHFTAWSRLDDPSGDAPNPVDLKGVAVAREGEHLVLRVKYHHPITPESISHISLGQVMLDADKDILTGFMNASEKFPTLGVDVLLDYKIQPLSMQGTVYVNLIMQSPQNPEQQITIHVGSYDSDTWYRFTGDQVEIGIPLGLLPPISDQAVMTVCGFKVVLGERLDIFPDKAAIRLKDGSLQAFNRATGPSVAVLDPPDDSTTPGTFNDEFVKMTVARCPEGYLVGLDYKELFPIENSITSFRLDIDKNAGTGERTYNHQGDTLMGVENTIVCEFKSNYIGKLTATLINGRSGAVIRGINQLVTVNFAAGQVYLTIPYRLIGVRSGINIQAQSNTKYQQMMFFSDDIPNTGVLAVPGLGCTLSWLPFLLN